MFNLIHRFFKPLRGVICIGSEGAQGAILQGNEVQTTFFVKDPSVLATDPILQEYPMVPLKILFDRDDIVFETHSIPPLSQKDTDKFLTNKLAEVRETDLKVAIGFSSEKEEVSLASPVTASLPRSAEIDAWLSALDTLPNVLISMGFLPLASVALSKSLADTIRYHVLISTQQCGGIRHILAHGNGFLATRLSPLPQGISVQGKMEALEKETYNTLSLLRKFAHKNADDCVLIFLATKSEKKFLESLEFPVKKVNIYTLEECCWKMGVAPGDDTSPSLAYAFFHAQQETSASFLPQSLSQAKNIYQSNRVLRHLSAACVALGLLIYIGSEGMSWVMGRRIASTKNEVARVEAQYRLERDRLAGSLVVPPSVMKAANAQVAAMLHSDLLAFKDLLAPCLNQHVTIKTLDWKRKVSGEAECRLAFYFHAPDRRDLTLAAFKGVKKRIKKVFGEAEIVVEKSPYGSSRHQVTTQDAPVVAQMRLVLPANWKGGS